MESEIALKSQLSEAMPVYREFMTGMVLHSNRSATHAVTPRVIEYTYRGALQLLCQIS